MLRNLILKFVQNLQMKSLQIAEPLSILSSMRLSLSKVLLLYSIMLLLLPIYLISNLISSTCFFSVQLSFQPFVVLLLLPLNSRFKVIFVSSSKLSHFQHLICFPSSIVNQIFSEVKCNVKMNSNCFSKNKKAYY